MSINESRFVVTGASGFLGSAITAYCASHGIACRAVSLRRIPAGSLEPDGDEILLHVGEPSVEAERDPSLDAACAALAEMPWRGMVYCSTALVYGDSGKDPRDPDHDQPNPPNDYARTKLAREEIFATKGGTIARLANLFGPGMSERSVLSDIFRTVRDTGYVQVRDLEPVRDYLWVDDAAAGVLMLGNALVPGRFNLGTGAGESVRDLARTVLTAFGLDEDRICPSSNPSGRYSRLILDPQKTTELTGWRPETSLAEGIERMAACGPEVN